MARAFSNEELYAPCGCGSGKKFKFCCYASLRDGAGTPAPASAAAWPPHVAAAEAVVARAVRQLERGDLDGARRQLEEARDLAPDYVRVRTNLALCLLAMGEAKAAMEELDAGLELAPDNMFVLGLKATAHLTLGETAKAKALAPRILHAPAPEATHAERGIMALAQLHAHQEVLDLVKRLDRSWLSPSSRLTAGFAALNVGDAKTAQHFLSTLRGTPREPLAQERLFHLNQGRFPPTLTGQYTYPHAFDALQLPTWMKRLPALHGAEARQFAADKPVLVEMLASMLELPEEQALTGLDLLARVATPYAVEQLRLVATGMRGSDMVRMRALRALRNAHGVKPGEVLRVHRDGRYRDLAEEDLPPPEDEDDGAGHDPLEVPDQHMQLYVDGCLALREGKLEKALRLQRELLRLLPEHPLAMHNVAVTLLNQNVSGDEPERLLRHALEVYPGYHYARASLAKLCIRDGKLEEAEAVLDPKHLSGKAHPTAVAQVMLALFSLHLQRKETEAALDALEHARTLAPDDQAVAAAVDANRLQLGLRKKLAEMDKKARRKQAQRQQVEIRPDVTVREALAPLTLSVLRALAKRWDVPGTGSLPKAELLGVMVGLYRDPRFPARCVDSLAPNARAALAHLLRLGGRAQEALIAREHDREVGAPAPPGVHSWRRSEPRPGVADQLVDTCAVVRGGVDGTLSLVVPEELRQGLAEALKRSPVT